MDNVGFGVVRERKRRWEEACGREDENNGV
jgi:hypothetical protein